MNYSLALLLASLALPVASGSVIVTLDQAALTGLPGQTLTFTGTLENTSAVEQFLSSLNLTTDPSLSGNPAIFLANLLPFLTPGLTLPSGPTVSFGMFEVEIPIFALPGTYVLGNEFTLEYGTSLAGGEFASAGFTVVVDDPFAVPEPSTAALAVASLGVAAAWFLRRS